MSNDIEQINSIFSKGSNLLKKYMQLKGIYDKVVSEEEIHNKFEFMINAFKYGTPPHGGIALGLDRLVALLVRANSIRDVIAFPKNAQAKCVMTQAPSEVSEEQLRELHIKLRNLPKVH